MTERVISQRFNGLRHRQATERFGLPGRPLPSWGYTRLAWPPLVADGRLFVASTEGAALAIDAADGRTLWRRELQGPINETISLDGSHLLDGAVLLLQDRGELFWLEAASGQELRRAKVPRLGLHTGAIIDRVLVAEAWDEDHLVLGYDLDEGRERWRRPGIWRQTVVASGGQALVLDDRATLTSVGARDGSVRWSCSLAEAGRFPDPHQLKPGRVEGWPILSGDAVLLGMAGCKLAAVSAADGRLKWLVDIPRVATSNLVLDPAGTLYVNSGDELVAVDPATGAVRAKHVFPETFGLIASAMDLSTTHAFSTISKTLVAVHKERGTIDWKHRFKSREGAGYAFSPIVAGGRLHALDGDGTLHVFQETPP